MRKKKSFRTAAVVLAIAAAVSRIPVAAAEDENTSDASSANASNYITDENFTNDMIGKNFHAGRNYASGESLSESGTEAGSL